MSLKRKGECQLSYIHLAYSIWADYAGLTNLLSKTPSTPFEQNSPLSPISFPLVGIAVPTRTLSPKQKKPRCRVWVALWACLAIMLKARRSSERRRKSGPPGSPSVIPGSKKGQSGRSGKRWTT
jgi:hypothetical protein